MVNGSNNTVKYLNGVLSQQNTYHEENECISKPTTSNNKLYSTMCAENNFHIENECKIGRKKTRIVEPQEVKNIFKATDYQPV